MHYKSPRVRRRRLLALVATAAVAAIALTGCSSGGSSSGPAQILTIGSDMSSFPSLDTGAITSAGYEGQRLIGNLIYEGLTKRDVSNPNKPAGVGAALAKSWDVSSDGLSYTFHLQPNVKFTDGTPFNASAVLYNIHRYMNKNDPHYNPQLITYYAVLAYVKDVTKVNNLTVKFTLNKPFAYFLSDLYNVYFASPTSLNKYGSAGQAKHPVGTGPFMFKSETANQSLTMVKNPNYWGVVPKLSQITIDLIPDPAARTAALRSGRVNWIEDVTPDDIASLKAAGFVETQKSFDWEWSWQLMTSQKPMNDIRVRQAMNFAIDRKAIADDLLHGTATPAYQAMAPASLYYSASNNIYDYDPAKAKELLTEAGYPNGINITVGYITAGSGSMQAQAMNEALQAQLAKVGINVTLAPVDFSSMYAKLGAGNTGWAAANQAFSLEQPSSWNGFWFGCSGNLFGYCNKDADALYAKALVTTNDAARAKLLTQVGADVTKDAAWMFVVNDTAPRMMSSKVKGYVQPESWWINFNKVYIGS